MKAKNLTAIVAAGILMVGSKLPLNYQEHFNNVYMQETLLINRDTGTTRINLTSSYNYRDDDSLSYYVGVKHFMFGPRKSGVEFKYQRTIDKNNNSIESKIESLAGDMDISIVSTKKDSYSPPKFKGIVYEDLHTGEDCYVIGYPMGITRIIKKTTIAAVFSEADNGCPLIMLGDKFVPGFSGAPVFVERKGKLKYVGMVNKYSDEIDASLVIPFDSIKPYLK